MESLIQPCAHQVEFSPVLSARPAAIVVGARDPFSLPESGAMAGWRRPGRRQGNRYDQPMVIVAPRSRPTRLLPYIAAGAALGVAVRELSASMWPMPAQRWVSVLLFAGVASFALGWMLAVKARPRLLAVVWGWSGALCSISAITTFVLGATPVWGLSCMALVPLSAATGVAMGAIVSIRRHQRRRTAGETSA